MFQRFCVLTIVVALAASLAPLASGARVRVRVEGRTTTIFGATEPSVAADHALGALESASLAGEFYYHVQTSSFGSYVDQIGRFPAGGTSGWVFKVNDISPPVGADKVELRDGDRVLWYFAQFGGPVGPPTLRLSRTRSRCYAVTALDDAGKGSKPSGAVLRVDGRTIRTRAGVACPGPHRGLVRATAPGAVRSNALK